MRHGSQSVALVVLGVCSAWAAPARADAEESAGSLGRYFGFGPLRVIAVDNDCGPAFVADLNGDGLRDIIIVNNRKSRIEAHLQRKTPLTEEEAAARVKGNDLPPSLYYERKEIGVSQRVTAVRAHDFNADGRLDLVYADAASEIVTLRQEKGGEYKSWQRRRAPGLSATRDGLAIADVTGGPEPELLTLAEGRVQVYPILEGAALGEPTSLGSGGKNESIIALFVEDYDGNGLLDILGAIPDDKAPLRLWRQTTEGRAKSGKNKEGTIGPELRFEMPALREAEPVRTAKRAAGDIAVIESRSRRIALLEVTTEAIEPPGSPGTEREVQAEVYGFPDADAKDRAVIVADIDQDGLPDLLASDIRGNRVVLHQQVAGSGLARGERFAAFKAPKALAAGQWDGAGALEVFVLSDEEKAVGVASYDAGARRLGFPQPIGLATPGASPAAMAFVTLADGPALAIIVQNKRDHTLEVHRPGRTGAEAMKITLEGVNRPPQSMLAADVDRDGKTDLLLFTPNEPMTMVRGVEDAATAKTLTDKTMPQFGLVQAAGPDNTALMDIDGDGHDELLIADKNFVRACAFDERAGWRVVEQFSEEDATTQFVGLATLPAGEAQGAPNAKAGAVVAADKTGKRLVVFTRAGEGGWAATDRIRLTGFDPRALFAGAFTGGGRTDLLAVSDGGFGVVRLAGERLALHERDSWRSDKEDRLEHEIATGDLNGDGRTDLVVLDAKEAMCQVFTLDAEGGLHFATEFEVFQSRLFERGEGQRRTEPSFAMIDDVTGDSAPDLILLAHDRILVYPQMTKSAASAKVDDRR